jgi:hypothetical protein
MHGPGETRLCSVMETQRSPNRRSNIFNVPRNARMPSTPRSGRKRRIYKSAALSRCCGPCPPTVPLIEFDPHMREMRTALCCALRVSRKAPPHHADDAGVDTPGQGRMDHAVLSRPANYQIREWIIPGHGSTDPAPWQELHVMPPSLQHHGAGVGLELMSTVEEARDLQISLAILLRLGS